MFMEDEDAATEDSKTPDDLIWSQQVEQCLPSQHSDDIEYPTNDVFEKMCTEIEYVVIGDSETSDDLTWSQQVPQSLPSQQRADIECTPGDVMFMLNDEYCESEPVDLGVETASTTGLSTSMEDHGLVINALGWKSSHGGGGRNNVTSHQADLYLDRSMRYLQTCGWWNSERFAFCLREANAWYALLCQSEKGRSLKNKHREFMKCVMKTYSGVDAMMTRLVLKGGTNGLTTKSAKYYLALLLYVECIPVELHHCVLEQYWTVASIGEHDPELKFFGC
eukprot:TRINITY_DN2696_c0_g1_i1.p1 TRINITY_DN2696_c0_g1~~TRINITY_DN2696_c0_g1_i1.p1  ORF type:complete len:278 (+),score=46.12 TRINITY_DN2696_c0_g1_i1:49-882(+)